MSSRKPEKTESKSGRKKLTLSKETLKDLRANAARVQGGARGGYDQGTNSNRICSF